MAAGRDRRRVVIGDVRPSVDGGRYPVKRAIGDVLTVEADVYSDGHEAISGRLLSRHERDRRWRDEPLEFLGNDLWRASFVPEKPGRYRYTVEVWLEPFQGWRRDMLKRIAARQDIGVDLIIGAQLISAAAGRASRNDARALTRAARRIADEEVDVSERVQLAMSDEIDQLVSRHPDRTHATRFEPELELWVDPVRARFSAWYELFPRSTSADQGRHGTFADVIRRLDYVEELGFDTLYLPPIHPIGEERRKGRNNRETAEPGEVGSPWAIGSRAGGHRAIQPELGTLEDFRELVDVARSRGIEVALDIAFQVAPDHPWVAEHPDWFRTRPDGTIQYAENPPKKYQDIYPFDFDTEDWRALWDELYGVFDFWVKQGVHTFRVDNPHTKPFAFWEWCVQRLRTRHPQVVLLSEAFTTPRRMEHLAKVGYNQSYTYFAWRNTKAELMAYVEELTQTELADYFRPSFWPNTPDILTEYLQTGGRAAFINRFILASTLSSVYGIYGPAFELMEQVPREHGSEEYLDSEKYQLRKHDLDDAESLRPIVARVNAIRRENPALHDNRTIRFHRVQLHGRESDHLIAYTKSNAAAPVSPTGRAIYSYEDYSPPPPGSDHNLILTIVNMDPAHTHTGWVELPLRELGILPDRPFMAHDLLSDRQYSWHGAWNFVELNPHVMPAHLFLIRQSD